MKVFFLSICLVTVFGLSACKRENNGIEPADLSGQMLDKLNRLRARGCMCGTDSMPPAPGMVWNPALERTATAHAQDMLNRNYFSHITPEGIPAIQRSRSQGYTGSSIGEVIARNYNTVDEVITAWRNSESHCKAMMDTTYNEVGAGKAGPYWVMDMGRKVN